MRNPAIPALAMPRAPHAIPCMIYGWVASAIRMAAGARTAMVTGSIAFAFGTATNPVPATTRSRISKRFFTPGNSAEKLIKTRRRLYSTSVKAFFPPVRGIFSGQISRAFPAPVRRGAKVPGSGGFTAAGPVSSEPRNRRGRGPCRRQCRRTTPSSDGRRHPNR